MARKFLYVVVALIVLATAAAFAYRLWGVGMMRMAMVPGESFRDQNRLTAKDYAPDSMWLARPALAGNPALWTPPGYSPRKAPGGAAVFFIHPTSYLNRAHWNAPLTDPEAVANVLQERAGDPLPPRTGTDAAPQNDEDIAAMTRTIQPRSDAPPRSGITGPGSGADSQ